MTAIRDDSCRELVGLATEYLESALAPEDRARFDAHLAECPGCVAWLEQIRATARLAREVPRPDLAPAERNRLRSALRAWRSGN